MSEIFIFFFKRNSMRDLTQESSLQAWPPVILEGDESWEKNCPCFHKHVGLCDREGHERVHPDKKGGKSRQGEGKREVYEKEKQAKGKQVRKRRPKRERKQGKRDRARDLHPLISAALCPILHLGLKPRKIPGENDTLLTDGRWVGELNAPLRWALEKWGSGSAYSACPRPSLSSRGSRAVQPLLPLLQSKLHCRLSALLFVSLSSPHCRMQADEIFHQLIIQQFGNDRE